ncbi:MAG: DUF1018 domain-containing protein [Acidobacteria bacterium]|nr:DUF1018 domain-containing protein [Acidobacteriota bacterium]
MKTERYAEEQSRDFPKKPLGKATMNQPSNKPFRTERITSGQIRILKTLWIAHLRYEGKRLRAETSRQARLQRISEIVGRPVQSSKELKWREANRVIERLLQELGVQHAAEKEVPFAEARSAEGVPEAMLRDVQLWKIQQVSQFLGWSHSKKCGKRLSSFLHSKFHVKQPEELTHDQARSAIEALCAVGACERIQRRKGKRCCIKQKELSQEVATLKQELHRWRPVQ